MPLKKEKKWVEKANVFGFEKDMPLSLFAKGKHYQVYSANNQRQEEA